MFELSVAGKYLIPRWRQLSVSIISLVSILVIALVVWLIVVFFSVKDGLENSWVDKIIALTAPIRVTPTDKYYASYYHQIDTISARADYTAKTIGEKLNAAAADPYDPTTDEELPAHWPLPDRDAHGQLKDLVKQVQQSASSLATPKNLKVSDFETTVANVRLRLLRHMAGTNQQSQQFLDHAAYIGSFDADTPALTKALLPLTLEDFTNLLHMQAISSDNVLEEAPDIVHRLDTPHMQKRLQDFFQAIEVQALKTPPQGWRLPRAFLPAVADLQVVAIIKDGDITRLIIPPDAAALTSLLQRLQSDSARAVAGELHIDSEKATLKLAGQDIQNVPASMPMFLEGNIKLPATVITDSIAKAARPQELAFDMHATIQGSLIAGKVSLDRLQLAEAKVLPNAKTHLFAHLSPQAGIVLPNDPNVGDAILLPKSFKEAGVLLGDQGYLSYHSPTPSSLQEQRVAVFVAGFYDPGIMPIGGKYILAPKDLIAMVRASYNQNDVLASNGLNIRFDNLSDAQKIKNELQLAFQRDGIAPYWHIETYQEYEFTKDLIQQLHSEKNLFSVISLVIIIVACSNIISMLIILVNDKKLEIGILRSMGATSGSIALIFGTCGMVMGTLGSLIGILAAFLTLRNLNALVDFIGRLQGYDLFNPVFYGNTLPSELSFEALSLVVMTTAFISLLAGIVPAVKASMLRPSAILRAE